MYPKVNGYEGYAGLMVLEEPQRSDLDGLFWRRRTVGNKTTSLQISCAALHWHLRPSQGPPGRLNWISIEFFILAELFIWNQKAGFLCNFLFAEMQKYKMNASEKQHFLTCISRVRHQPYFALFWFQIQWSTKTFCSLILRLFLLHKWKSYYLLLNHCCMDGNIT